jgi:aryl-alcohol dehydrogenase-like predicted oxidoreductase
MKYRKLGQTDVEVSVVGMGCWAFASGGPWGEQDEEDSIRAAHAGIDAGITLFDTAEGYGGGRSEEVVGKALAGKRDKVVVATKASGRHHAPDELPGACEESLRRLGMDHIDVYQLHWPCRDVPFADTYGALEKLKEQGKIRVIGVSNFGPNDIADITDSGRIEVDQLPYSLLWRAIEYDITEVCEKKDISVLCYSPLAQGLLTGKFKSRDDIPEGRQRPRYCKPEIMADVFASLDDMRSLCADKGISMAHAAIAWAAAQPAVGSALVGARNADQAESNAQAGDLSLDNETVAALSNMFEKIKALLGSNPDMWKGDEDTRYR